MLEQFQQKLIRLMNWESRGKPVDYPNRPLISRTIEPDYRLNINDWFYYINQQSLLSLKSV